MKTLIPAELKGKELYQFLIANKAVLINEKKSLPRYTDSLSAMPSLFQLKKGTAAKAGSFEVVVKDDNEPMNDEVSDVIRVKTVANACNWCDSQMDVLIKDSSKRTIKERKNMIPHLHDHVHSIEAKVGEVADIYLQDINLTDLGVKLTGFTQCIVFETDVFKSYNEKIFNQYKLKKINQHSIGLQYIHIELAINDEDYEKEMDFWNKYYPLVINKDVVDEYGFFWVVSEIKLLENSCVLFGSNELTPTLNDTSGAKTLPLNSIEQQPPADEETFDLSAAIKATTFFNN